MNLCLAAAACAALAMPVAEAAAKRPQPADAAQLRRTTERFLHREQRRPRASGQVVAPSADAILPTGRVVALYGAPQMPATAVGMRSPEAAMRKIASQSKPYGELGTRPVTGELDLVSVLATAGAGTDRKYRFRQDAEVISAYLEAARAAGARLMLDIQPGRSTFRNEIRALREWIVQPDVDVALDPEWNVGRRGVPGRTPGKVGATQLNKVIASLATTVSANGLSPKLLVVHQFRSGSVRGRARIKPRDGVQTVLNFDGIGSPRAKAAGYVALGTPKLFNGFSLFYARDRPLMDPTAVLALEAEPDFLLYQ